MTSLNIAGLMAWEALDSRGRPTVACRVDLEGGGTGRVVVPSGKSTGTHEAKELRDGGDRYAGFGVRRAVESINTSFRTQLLGKTVADRVQLDGWIEEIDGTRNLGRLGANAALGVSLATFVANADGQRLPLWQTLTSSSVPLIPMPMVNIVSGGAHAGKAIDIQDVLVVPVGAGSFAEAIEWVDRVRRASCGLIDQIGGTSALIADEGGLSGNLKSNEAALQLVAQGIDRSGLDAFDQVAIAMDVAADQLMVGDSIELASEGRQLGTSAWLDLVADWVAKYPLISVEDPLSEDDWLGWRTASQRLTGIQVIGDDLFATDSARLQRGIEHSVANAILVKPNQAGTVSRAENVMRQAKADEYATIVSARSGDTEDSWLADLAVGWRAGQIKVGSTMRSERTAKWNRLLEIESIWGGEFAGRQAIVGLRSGDQQTRLD